MSTGNSTANFMSKGQTQRSRLLGTKM